MWSPGISLEMEIEAKRKLQCIHGDKKYVVYWRRETNYYGMFQNLNAL